MSFASRLINRVVHEVRSVAADEDGQEIEAFTDGATLPASVQDRAPTELNLPDIDGPVIVNARVFLLYADGLDVAHLDRLRQVDVTPNRIYTVIYPNDPAGVHHHWELDCERVLTLAAVGS